MALTDKLRNLDQKLLPGTREPDEDAESYLRRVAAGRAVSPAQAGDVMAALRQYFGVEEGQASNADAAKQDEAGDESEDDSADDEAEPNEKDDDESGSDEKEDAES